MNESQRAKWERTRGKGFWRYVLLHWVLLFGGFMIIMTSISDYFISRRGFRLEDLVIKIPIFLIIGFLAGAAMWFYVESKYKKSSSNAS
jgi:uncharacterized membrane protein